MAVKVEDYIPVIKYNGLNTAKDITASGTNTFSGATTLSGTNTLSGATTVSGTLAATSTLAVTGTSTLTGAVNFKRQVTDTGGAFATPIALTEAQSGRVILVDDSAGLDFTLPAVAAAQIGTNYLFIVTVTIATNSFRVTAQSGDLLNGGFWISDFNTANTGSYFAADDSDDLILTLNGTTTGGKKGSWVEFIATTATQWFVRGEVFGDGTLATPFS